ncbi:protein PHLOEM PROTEIN 2-LIKE A9 [Cocos nucifera]|uniref:Protein PHLOEM PROTEIN 2-LIKE A9 n=1 Tax=Cocos nucifera TaxID=13894 RepID=A0A8K0IR98_COCNU|nr:protein PHLOEM PROTEIN 2-LIKE A9 [Cocos nucifera]
MSHYKGSGRVLEGDNFSKPLEGNKVMIKPQALDIIWGNDSRYWRVNQNEAELLQVCWLEVTGSYPLKELLKGRNYKLSFNVSTRPDAFGWGDSPVYLMVKVGAGPYTWKKADLSQLKNNNIDIPITSPLTFTVPTDPKEDKITFGLYEIWRGRWKGGLVIHHVLIEPAN